MKKRFKVLMGKSDVQMVCNGCKWFQKYDKPWTLGKGYVGIGWCERFKPDPDAGYIFEFHVPPCASYMYDSCETVMQL